MNTIILLCAMLGTAFSAPSGGYASQPAYGQAVQLISVNQPRVPLYQIRVPVQQYVQPNYGLRAHQQPVLVQQVKAAPIVTGSLHLAQDTYGQYKYGYSSSDGQEKSESREASGATEGQFSYTSPEGVYIKLAYEADKDGGFRATGDHLPVAPAMPAELAAAYQESYARLAQAYEEARLRGDTEESDDGSYKEEKEDESGKDGNEGGDGEDEEEEKDEGKSEGGEEEKKEEHQAPSAPLYQTYVRPVVAAPAVQYKPVVQAPVYQYVRPVAQTPVVQYRPIQAPTYYISAPVTQAPAPVQTYYVSAPSQASYAAPAHEEKKEEKQEEQHQEKEEEQQHEEEQSGPIPYLQSSYSTEIGGTPIASAKKSSDQAQSAPSKSSYY